MVETTPFGRALGAWQRRAIVVVLAVGLLSTSYLIWTRYRDAKERLERVRSYQAADFVPEVGTVVREILWTSAEGKNEVLALGNSENRKTLLLAYQWPCRYCSGVWEQWSRLSEAGNPSMRLVAIDLTLGGLDPALGERVAASLVLRNLAAQSHRLLGLGVLPQTILVGADAKVEAVWLGTLDAGTMKRLTAR